MIEAIRACVQSEVEQVDQLIIEQLHSDVDMVENVGQYIVDAGGKRLRPLLVLLAGEALGGCTESHIRFSAVVEFIHTATLLHDDVVDVSTLRRGRPTANEAFGNAPSVLVGDFLYTRAFQLMVQLDNMDLLRHMADTTNTIAEGEVLQLARAGNPDIDESQYIDVITRKTAILFASACQGAAMLANCDIKTQQALSQYGLNLGIAFQMIDDVLDYEGDPTVTGKNIGDDLNEGKTTLPLLHTMQTGSKPDRDLVAQSLREKSTASLSEVIAAVRRSGSLDFTRERARERHDLAMSGLDVLQENRAKAALSDLLHLSLERAS
ncbi:octaprenyl-diphosphate synthase [Luminiphilus syltensis NOR5-1B]|uniref:Octaprenyl diphosphate synthase n=1 Tax=Luminiphilus syltensis NOR5-1B TaxID=565045 RepID=B8KWK2_9GAMM|nr:polyprenyl synthetase family protein [Luminiphilus syltensis]EED36649.1 octaprenyl-diphosphate synthase [Luminiphilus syltensis NOR5-1B]